MNIIFCTEPEQQASAVSKYPPGMIFCFYTNKKEFLYIL